VKVRAAWLAWLCAGCLSQEQVGSLVPADAGCDAACSSEDAGLDPRVQHITELIERLTQSAWIGTARTGGSSVECAFAFAPDGRYEVLNKGNSPVFMVFFPGAVEQVLKGRYTVTDYFMGQEGAPDQYAGFFEDPFGGTEMRLDFERLTLEGDRLSFERPGFIRGGDFSFTMTVELSPLP
jgi:hypothetical protein